MRPDTCKWGSVISTLGHITLLVYRTVESDVYTCFTSINMTLCFLHVQTYTCIRLSIIILSGLIWALMLANQQRYTQPATVHTCTFQIVTIGYSLAIVLLYAGTSRWMSAGGSLGFAGKHTTIHHSSHIVHIYIVILQVNA